MFVFPRLTVLPVVIAAMVVLLVACAPQSPEPIESAETDDLLLPGKEGLGQKIAQAKCSGCHALSMTGDSSHPDAPAFRDLSRNYPVKDLAESLAEGIMVGHPDMPVFSFTPKEVDALIEFLESLQAPLPT